MNDRPEALFGDDARPVLAHALGQVQDLLSYLRSDIGSVPISQPDQNLVVEDGMWLGSADLINDHEWLARVIEGTGRAIGTDDQVIAASIFVQGYAYRLLTLAVACLTSGGIVPGSRPEAIAVGLGRGRVSKVAYLDPEVFSPFSDQPPVDALANPAMADSALQLLIRETIDQHLRLAIAATREQIRIGERLLWGNVAASASTAFRTMEGCLGSWVERLGHRFFEVAPPELQGLGSFLLIESAGKRGWFWERTNCCLFYQIEGHAKCADCSLTPKAERRATYEEGLQP